MNEITPLGWIIIVFVIAIFVGTNLSLFGAVRKRNQKNESHIADKLIQTARNPFEKEDLEWKKLADQVASIKKNRPDEQPLQKKDRS